MGTTAPNYHRQLSFTPQESPVITPLGPIISSLQAQPIDTMSPTSGRVL
jgi:hypothetical protein